MKKNAIILLVEDDDVDVMAVKRAMKQNEMTNPLFIVSDGEEALRFLLHEDEYADTGSAPRPDLILLDLNMPRMNGLEFLRIMKKDEGLREIPVVVLTTSDEEKDVKLSYAHCAAGYIVKPVSFDNFVEAVKTLFVYWTLNKTPKQAAG